MCIAERENRSIQAGEEGGKREGKNLVSITVLPPFNSS